MSQSWLFAANTRAVQSWKFLEEESNASLALRTGNIVFSFLSGFFRPFPPAIIDCISRPFTISYVIKFLRVDKEAVRNISGRFFPLVPHIWFPLVVPPCSLEHSGLWDPLSYWSVRRWSKVVAQLGLYFLRCCVCKSQAHLLQNLCSRTIGLNYRLTCSAFFPSKYHWFRAVTKPRKILNFTLLLLLYSSHQAINYNKKCVD